MADQSQARRGILRTEFADEIGEIVVELADIADVAARPGSAVAARINGRRLSLGAAEPLK